MKKILLSILLLCFANGYSQQNWQKTWGTYFFASAVSGGYTVVDSQGNIVMAGYVGGGNDYVSYPFYSQFTTAGCHKSNLVLADVLLCKFSPDGTLLWATFYGGESEERVFSLCIDNNDNIYLSGFTTSLTGIATPGAYISTRPDLPSQTTTNGTSVGFLTKFSPGGMQLWGTYFPLALYSMCVNSNNEVYVSGNCTADYSGMATANTYQDTPSQNADYNSNIYINKFDTNGNRLAGTYIGPMIDYGTSKSSLACDYLGNVYLSFSTRTLFDYPPNGYYGSPGCHQALNSGNYDMVISKFNGDLTQRLWSTYYGGNFDDYGAIKINGDALYLFGKTNSGNNIATAGTQQTSYTYESGTKYIAYLAKFNLEGVRQWGSYFGGSSGLETVTASETVNDAIYLTGRTLSPNLATPNVYETSCAVPATTSKQYFGAFNDTDGTLSWVSYFCEGGVNICFNPEKTAFYLTGTTASTTNISTTGAWQPTLLAEPNYAGTPRNFYINKFSSSLLTNWYEKKALVVSPNPTRGTFSLQGDWQGSTEGLSIFVYDQLGRVVASQVLGSINQKVCISNLSKGIYILQLFINNKKQTGFKMVVE